MVPPADANLLTREVTNTYWLVGGVHDLGPRGIRQLTEGLCQVNEDLVIEYPCSGRCDRRPLRV
jgi:hypothetical protein